MTSLVRAIDLRLDRAGEHLIGIERLVTDYVVSDPYTVDHRIEGKKEEHVYRLAFTKQPDEQIPVVVGDFLHNLRSALNYLMVALTPKSRKDKTQFPIFEHDPFATDPVTGHYIHRQSMRDTWNKWTTGVDPKALAYIKELQPWSLQLGKIHGLYALNLLSNADKHRDLVVVPQGLEDGWVTINGAAGADLPRLIKDGAEVHRSPAEVEVQLGGSAVVLTRVGWHGSSPEMRIGAFTDLLLYVRGMVVGVLIGYARDSARQDRR